MRLKYGLILDDWPAALQVPRALQKRNAYAVATDVV